MNRFILAIFLTIVFVSNVIAGDQDSIAKYDLQVDRFGPVTVGMEPSEASRLLGVPLSFGVDPDEDDSDCHYVYPDGKFEDIGFMVEDGRITRIDVYSAKIATTGQVRVGDDESVVRKAFPGLVRDEIHPYIGKEGKYMTVETKPGYAFVFETDTGKITTFRAGNAKSVPYIEGCL